MCTGGLFLTIYYTVSFPFLDFSQDFLSLHSRLWKGVWLPLPVIWPCAWSGEWAQPLPPSALSATASYPQLFKIDSHKHATTLMICTTHLLRWVALHVILLMKKTDEFANDSVVSQRSDASRVLICVLQSHRHPEHRGKKIHFSQVFLFIGFGHLPFWHSLYVYKT